MKRISAADFRCAAGAGARRVGSRRRAGRRRPAGHAELPGSTTPCAAAVRMTGIQGAPRAGPRTRTTSAATATSSPSRCTLSKPTADQIDFFNTNFGSPAAGAPVGAAPRRHAQDAPQLPPRRADATFRRRQVPGLQPDVRADRSRCAVKKTNWIGITVPTWAPMFAQEPDRLGLVARLARQGQLRAAQELQPVRAADDPQDRRASAAPTTASGCSSRPPTCPTPPDTSKTSQVGGKGLSPVTRRASIDP